MLISLVWNTKKSNVCIWMSLRWYTIMYMALMFKVWLRSYIIEIWLLFPWHAVMRLQLHFWLGQLNHVHHVHQNLIKHYATMIPQYGRCYLSWKMNLFNFKLNFFVLKIFMWKLFHIFTSTVEVTRFASPSYTYRLASFIITVLAGINFLDRLLAPPIKYLHATYILFNILYDEIQLIYH